MKRTLLILPLIFVLSALPSGSPDPDIAGIEQAVQHYLDGHATGDPRVMTRAFHQSARLQFIREGQYSTRALEAYLGGMGGSPAEDESDRRRRVVSIGYTGDAGVAKLELDYPGALITDYMQLLKIGGEWKIVNKIFTVQRR
ncbi:MAG: nuclear transport factor 2 family protein [Gemmatimonadales bacterium]|nr:nuclear transport factor 2 family protein [Gemmatimonadales bacterium]